MLKAIDFENFEVKLITFFANKMKLNFKII
jgi:hypothetical protein